ncbi:MAG: hypothetical protein KAX19_06420 [Candidatus Brocadiae bacterium]|nr:hypothetical protein [Candidatus Brocadiia bacterium]
MGAPNPSDESLGYYQASLGDAPTAHIFQNACPVFSRRPDLCENNGFEHEKEKEHEDEGESESEHENEHENEHELSGSSRGVVAREPACAARRYPSWPGSKRTSSP